MQLPHQVNHSEIKSRVNKKPAIIVSVRKVKRRLVYISLPSFPPHIRIYIHTHNQLSSLYSAKVNTYAELRDRMGNIYI